MPFDRDRYSYVPFCLTALLVMTCFIGLGYSFYPYLVPETITVWDAAASTSSLIIMLVGALIVLPIILVYTAVAHWLFRGKAPASY